MVSFESRVLQYFKQNPYITTPANVLIKRTLAWKGNAKTVEIYNYRTSTCRTLKISSNHNSASLSNAH